MGKILNFKYACIQGSYWMLYGVVGSFASVFLLARGYSNSEIGIILAVANVVAVVLQPLVADFVDRSKKVTLIGMTQLMTIVMILMMAGLCILQRKTLALSLIFLMLIAWHTILQPLINSLSFKLQECGIHINFGVARGLGSLAYSALVGVLGTVVENYGIIVMPITGEVVLVMLLISLALTRSQYNKVKTANTGKDVIDVRLKGEETEGINLLDFLKRNKVFLVVNIGVIGVFFSNQILNNYMIQIVNDVGGDSGDMGRILSLMAFLEIPVMFCFDSLRKRFSCQLMLKVSAAGFVIKIAMCYIATSVTMVYIAQSFQLISFGLFLPAMVHFIDEMMSKGEAVKGQAFFTMMITVTTMISSLFGGVILDVSGAKMLTLTATIITAVGALIIIGSVDRVKSK